MTTSTSFAESFPYQNPKLPLEKRVEDLLGRMTLEEKLSMAAGEKYMDTRTIERLGIPAIKMCDGPHGVRVDKATCFPTAVSWGASWDPELMYRVGVALALETRARGRNLLLGPCINIHRTPLGGRNFESFSEDPFLISRMVVAYVKGVQGQGVGTSTKHYAANNQEWERTTIDVQVDERTLREIYLPGFRAAVKEADTWSVMGAYNRLNGPYCCASPHLLTQILKKDFGFRGFVVSDWGAVHGTVDSANAGLDLEMPGPGQYFADALAVAVKNGEVSEEVITDKARRILRVAFLEGLFEGADEKGARAIDTPEHRALAREAGAKGMVLLKNEGNVLPIDRGGIQSIAVIGPNAAQARVGGGGSSTVNPFYSVSPLDGVRNLCGDQPVVRYEEGCPMPGSLDAIRSDLLFPPESAEGVHGLLGEYFDNKDLAGNPVLTRIDPDINFDWGDKSPAPHIPCDGFSARWTGSLVPDETTTCDFGMVSDDGCRIWIDDELIVDSWIDQAGIARTARITFEAGRRYKIRAEFFENVGGASAKLGWIRPDNSIDRAVAAARESDIALVFVGLSPQFEGEGLDRENMDLPAGQDELIEAVVAANPNTVVVLVNGTPVNMMRWIDKVPAVLEAWYAGQEGGNAMADVLFGRANPSGKLPVTFPRRLEDNPSTGNYPGGDGVVRYAEGIFVGYRHYDTRGVEPLFPFGHGLSYTRFDYSNLKIRGAKDGDGFRVTVSFDVQNAGARGGAEVAQLYVADPVCRVERPAKELKGFQKIELAPGEKKTVQIQLGPDAFAFFDPDRGTWSVEPGAFDILAGSSSRDIRLTGSYTVSGD